MKWSNKSAPVQWKDQPKEGKPTRSTAKDDQSDPFVEEDIPDDD
jgi:hypothetical protein